MLPISIGVLGFLSAITTLFIDTNQSISVRWLIFLIFISLVLLTALIGIIIELFKNNHEGYDLNQLKLIDMKQNAGRGEVYLNKSNINFDYGDVVKVYYLDKDKIEKFIGLGVIGHIQKQEKICHIEFLFKNEIEENKETINEVFFSLKINKDELAQVVKKDY